jgi:hypothetical protein
MWAPTRDMLASREVAQPSRWPHNPLQIGGFVEASAEGEGFEPSVDRKAHNGFRDWLVRAGLVAGRSLRVVTRLQTSVVVTR